MNYLTSSILLVMLYAIQARGEESIKPLFESSPDEVQSVNIPEASVRIDELVVSRLAELNLKPANPPLPS